MEPKRELSSVDLRALAGELDTYADDPRVDKAYLYEQDLVRLKLRDFERGRIELLIEVGEQKRLNIAPAEYVSDAPERPPNFAKMLRNRLSGASLVSVEQYEFDRIVSLTFERGNDRTTLVAELFGDGNVAVLDETDTVVDALRTVRLRSRTVAPGSTYEFPDSRLYPFELDRETFEAQMRESSADVVRTLATQLNLGGTYAEEICARADIEPEQAIEQVDEATYDHLYHALVAIGERLERRTFDPVIVLEDEQPVDVTPFPLLQHEHRDHESFETMNEATATYFHRLSEQEDGPQEPQSERPDFEAEIAKYERMIEQQSRAIEDFEAEADQTRERAETLYAHYDVVDEVLTVVGDAREEGFTWDDIEERLEAGAEQGLEAAQAVTRIEEDGTVWLELDETEIPVDPRMGVEQNANELYQEAKRIGEKREGAEAALAESKAELEAIKEREASWSAPDTTPEPAEDEDPDWVRMSSVPVRTSDEWYEQFRWMHTSDEFLVIGGRNADQNEELVQKYMEPGDRFVHAQAHGGPVTLLKATGPSEASRDVTFPERTIEEAAQFAVSYSSVWKAGQFAGDAYLVSPDQVSKEPESGEYLQKGGFVIRGDREYVENVPLEIAVGITCEPYTRVIGGPPAPIRERAAVLRTVEPGDIAQSDVAMRIYRSFREEFTDTSFVRKVASADRIQEFLPPGKSRVREQS